MRHIRLFVFAFVFLLSINLASAENMKFYNETTRTESIWWGLLGIPISHVADVTLLSPNPNYVIRGQERLVMEFSVNLFQDTYDDFFNNFTIYKLTNGKKLTRNYAIKSLRYAGNITVPTYNYTCYYIYPLGYPTEYCNRTQNGTKSIETYSWHREFLPINLNRGITRIGIFADVVNGDKCDGIPKLFDLDMNDWAVWTESLNINLTAFWKMNESAGNINDSLGLYNGTASGTGLVYQRKGVINGSIYSAGTGYFPTGATFSNGTYNKSFSIWVNVTASSGAGWVFGAGTTNENGKGIGIIPNYGTAGDLEIWGQGIDFTCVGRTFALNNFHHVAMTYDGITRRLYIDGDNCGNSTSALLTGTLPITIGADRNPAVQPLKGAIDEFGIWNRTLTTAEVLALYNGGAGITYEIPQVLANISVTLSSPTNGQLFNYSSINFTGYGNSTLDGQFNNFTIKIWNDDTGALYYNATQVITGNTSNATSWLLNIADADYRWNIEAVANNGSLVVSAPSNWSFTVDTTKPNITIYTPAAGQNFSTFNMPYNVTLNATIIDANLQYCQYANNDTDNATMNCNSLKNVTFNTGGWKTIRVWANDSVGNSNNASQTFFINYAQYFLNYDFYVYEGQSSRFYFNISADSITNVSNVTLFYNNTGYSMIGSFNSTYANFSTQVAAPLNITSSENKSFYVSYLYNNVAYNTTTYQQTLTYLQSFNLTSTCNRVDQAVLFTIMDEQNLTLLNETVDFNFNYRVGNSTEKAYFGTITNQNTFYLCMNTSLSNAYTLTYGELNYYMNAYALRKYYFFNNHVLTNATESIRLIDIAETDATTFTITFENNLFSPYTDHYAGLMRWYPELNDYYLVEMAKTDDDGKAVFRVKTNDVDYRIALWTTEGTLVYMNSPIRLSCSVLPCEYVWISPSTTALYNTLDSLTHYLSFNRTSKVFTYTYSDSSQAMSLMNLTVYRDTSYSSVPVCQDTSTNFIDVLTCDVSAYTGTLRAEVFRSASPSEAVAQLVANLGTALSDLAGGRTVGLFLSFILFVFAFISAIYNPIAAIVLGIASLVPSLYVGAFGYSTFIGIIVIGFAVIHFLRRS